MSDRTRELLIDRALWGLSPEELHEFGQLVGGANRAEEISEFDVAAASVTMTYLFDAGAQAPDHVVRRLRDSARGYFAAPTPAPSPRAVPPTRSLSTAGWLGWITAAAASVALAIVLFDAEPEVAPIAAEPTVSEQRVALLGTDEVLTRFDWDAGPSELRGNPSGDVVWSTERQAGFMTFRGLPVNDPTRRQYQLWIFDRTRDAAHPVDGGVFDIPAGRSEVIVPIDAKVDVREAFAFAVTVEEPGGVVVSDREEIVVTAGL